MKLKLLALAAAIAIGGAAQAQEPVTIGAVQMVAEHEWFRTIELGMQAAADKAGAELLVANAQGQVDTEAAHGRQLRRAWRRRDPDLAR